MEMSKLGFVLRKKIGSRHFESEIDNQGRIKVLEPKTIETENGRDFSTIHVTQQKHGAWTKIRSS